MNHQDTLAAIEQEFVSRGYAFDSGTKEAYQQAIQALTLDYINVSDLPMENDWYKTLRAFDLIDMQFRPLFYAGSPRGGKIDYKLKGKTNDHSI